MERKKWGRAGEKNGEKKNGGSVMGRRRALLLIFTKKKNLREQEIIKDRTFISKRKVLFFIIFF